MVSRKNLNIYFFRATLGAHGRFLKCDSVLLAGREAIEIIAHHTFVCLLLFYIARRVIYLLPSFIS